MVFFNSIQRTWARFPRLRLYSSISGSQAAMWWREGRALAVSVLHISTTLALAWSPSIGIRSAAESGRVWSDAAAVGRAQLGGSGSKPSRWSTRRRSSSAVASAVDAKVQTSPRGMLACFASRCELQGS